MKTTRYWLAGVTTVVLGAGLAASARAATAPSVVTVGRQGLESGPYRMLIGYAELGQAGLAARSMTLDLGYLKDPVWVRCKIEHQHTLNLTEVIHGKHWAGEKTTIEPDGSGIVDFSVDPAPSGRHEYVFAFPNSQALGAAFLVEDCTITKTGGA